MLQQSLQADSLPEVWLRGPLPNLSPLLQPVGHALLQAKEELHAAIEGFPETLVWEMPAGVAPVGFHLQHLSGVLDRLFTYARGMGLNEGQLSALSSEGNPSENRQTVGEMLQTFDGQVSQALEQLANTSEQTLLETRYVGRARIPSTQLGLFFHAAEHTMRHLGQLLVTVRILS